jgi:hypothetical protein
MNGHQYILARQTEWAKNKGLELIGSQKNRGRPIYTSSLDDNLFHPLVPDVRRAFSTGDGGELGSQGTPGKMQALHSSSALGVNIFQYWKAISKVPAIASACKLCKQGSQVSEDISFEEKYPIDDGLGYHPNIDVVISNASWAWIQRFAIECKFSEAYGAYQHAGLKPKYLELVDLWTDIPNLRMFAERICPDDHEFIHLHPAQLVKHILGLKRQLGKGRFRLLYLWYDVFGEQGNRHREEVNTFSAIAKQDGVMFHSLTYQELIAIMAKQLRAEHHEYISYITERYL